MKKSIHFYYQEKGCPHCETVKPIVAEYVAANPDVELVEHKLKSSAEVPEPFPKSVPLFVAYLDGNQVSLQTGYDAHLDLAFTPEKIPVKPVPIEQAGLLQLIQEEANLIDKIYPLSLHLKAVQKEIAKRKGVAAGKEACCEGCATGGGCSGGSCGGGH